MIDAHEDQMQAITNSQSAELSNLSDRPDTGTPLVASDSQSGEFNIVIDRLQTTSQVLQHGAATEDVPQNEAAIADLRERFKKFIDLSQTMPVSQRRFLTKVSRRLPQADIDAINFIIKEFVAQKELNLWDINCITYAGALAILERNNLLKDRKFTPRPTSTKRSWVIQREEKINALRKKISHVMLTIECASKEFTSCSRKQQKIILSTKRLCKGLGHEKLTAKLAQMKHDLRAELTRLKDDINRADRNSMNRKFKSNPKLVYRAWRDHAYEVKNPPTAEEIHRFWHTIWGKPNAPNLENAWFEQLCASYCKNVTPKVYTLTEPLMKDMLNRVPNNRSPGSDLITGFWLKQITALHEHLKGQFSALQSGIIGVPDWLTTSRTTLIPKNPETHATNNYRPIACQNTTYKLYTSILNYFIEDHCTTNNILCYEQAGGRKGSWGCTDQLLINKMILDELKMHKRSAFLMWFDYKKAYDSVPHEWIRKALELIKLPADILSAIERLMASWNTKVFLNTPTSTIETANIRFENGVLQGDCLAMALFMLAINPLSHLLQECDGYTAGPPGSRDTKITHLLFVDDLKTFDQNRTHAEEKLRIITNFTNDIGMKLGEDKCAYLNIERGQRKSLGRSITMNGFTMQELKNEETYKYLGVDEDTSYCGPVNKERLLQEYLKRVKKIWRSNLNSKNKVTAHNTFAVPLLTPTFGILDWTKAEVQQMDIKTRKTLTMLGAFHRNSDIDRLYVDRKRGGRGMISILDAYITRLVSLSDHIMQYGKYNPLIAKVRTHEEKMLLKTAESIRHCLNIPPYSTSDPATRSVKSRLQAAHVEAWGKKPMHGYLNRKMSALSIDLKSSHSWTNSTKLTSHIEGYLCAIQEQEIETRLLAQKRSGIPQQTASSCRHCKSHPEDISHIVGSCPSLASKMYLPLRHNEVGKTLYNAIIQNVDKSMPYRAPEKITCVGSLEIWWDTRINTAPRVQNNKPDMLVWNNAAKECSIVEIGVPLDVNVTRVESVKGDTYIPLVIALKRLYPEHKFQTVPIVIGATGAMTTNLKSNLSKLGFRESDANSLACRLQEKAILGTVKIVKSALGKHA